MDDNIHPIRALVRAPIVLLECLISVTVAVFFVTTFVGNDVYLCGSEQLRRLSGIAQSQ